MNRIVDSIIKIQKGINYKKDKLWHFILDNNTSLCTISRECTLEEAIDAVKGEFPFLKDYNNFKLDF